VILGSLVPNFAAAYMNRGFAELGKGMDSEAERDFRKALEISASLKPIIEKESGKMMQERKARQKH
jgi:Tfp pilus assembly protein PilF